MSANLRASLLMMLSMAGFTINDVLIKSLDGVFPNVQVMAVRGAVLCFLIAGVLWHRGLLSRLAELATPLVGFRALMELCATFVFLTVLVQLPYANITAILQVLPLAVAIGAALIFKESVGWRRWLAIAIGFTGVLIIIRPGAQGFQSASLLVLMCVVFAAARDLATRALPSAVPSLLVSMATALVVTAAGAIMLIFQHNWVVMSLQQFAVLALAALFLFVGYQCIVLSMRTGDMAYVVPFRYTSLLWAIGLGYLFFGEVPDTYTLVGSSVVIAMGLFTLYRELLLSRRVSAGASGRGG